MFTLSAFWEPLIITIVGGVIVAIFRIYFQFGTVYGAFALNKRELVYSVNNVHSLCDFAEKELVKPSKRHLDICWNGQLIERIYIVVVNIRSTGRTHIQPADHFQPLRIEVVGNILHAELTDAAHSGIKPSLETLPTHVEVEPLLINPGDTITITLLLSEFKSLDVTGHIVGMRRIKLARSLTDKIRNIFLPK